MFPISIWVRDTLQSSLRPGGFERGRVLYFDGFLLAFLSADNCVGFLCWACCTSPCPSFTIHSLMPFSQSPFSVYLKQKQRPLWPQHRLSPPSTTPRQPELPPPSFKAATPPIWIPHTTKNPQMSPCPSPRALQSWLRKRAQTTTLSEISDSPIEKPKDGSPQQYIKKTTPLTKYGSQISSGAEHHIDSDSRP